MQLIQINKARYRKHLNRVIVGCAASLAIGSLAISQTLIALFPDESGSHFHWNLLGVIVTSIGIGWVFWTKNHTRSNNGRIGEKLLHMLLTRPFRPSILRRAISIRT